MPELRMFFTDTVLEMKLKAGFDVFQDYDKLGARRQIFLNLLLVI